MKTPSVLLTGVVMASVLLGSTPASAFSLIANPFKGQPLPYYTQGDQVLDAARVEYQIAHVAPRCRQFAKEVVPGGTKMFFYYGWNSGLGNGVANAGSTYIEHAIVGTAVAPPVGIAIGVGSFAAGAVLGGIGGLNTKNAMEYSYLIGCLSQDAAGLHAIPPSWGKLIKEGKMQPVSFGSPFATNQSNSSAAAATTATTGSAAGPTP